jgi:Kef-type K+ transport system membrane component KefB
MEAGQFLITLVIIFGGAKLFGELAERIGQPAVLGELFAGIVFGASFLHWIDPHDVTLHLLAELGVVLLLFLIGLETDLGKLLSVGVSSALVAAVGVALPFALGFGVARFLGYPTVLSIFVGAALTATSVGITARVLSDLGQLGAMESQVVIGAAVIDDIIGLVILTIVSALAKGEEITAWMIGRTAVVAFGFVAIAIVVGSLLAPRLISLITRLRVGKALLFASLMFAFGLAWAADQIGSALIVGAFAAGLVLARTEKGPQIAHEINDISQFFVPIFFVSVGAAIDLRSINPFDPATRPYFLVGLLLTAVAIVGKVLAGFAAVGPGLRRIVIGVGMIPRGEVGLIFARIGLAAGLLSVGVYSSVAAMVMVTTFITPPLLRMLLPQQPGQEFGALARIVTEVPLDDDFKVRREAEPLGG